MHRENLMAKPQLNLNISQGVLMTPSLRQAIELLQMPMNDLSAFVENEMLENPCLSNDDGMGEEDTAEETHHESQDVMEALDGNTMGDDDIPLDYEWDSMYESGSGPLSSGVSSGGNSGDDFGWEQTAHDELTLKDHLKEQFAVVTTEPVLSFLAHYLIDSVDDSGYIRLDLKEVAKRLQVDVEKLEDALAIIQTFEPIGVGARDLADCLRLQLHSKKQLTDAADIVLKNLDLLAKRDFKKLCKLAKCDMKALQIACLNITECTPKPGLIYGVNNAEAVLPDVVVMSQKGMWTVNLNAEAMPKVLMNSDMQNLMPNAKGEQKSYMTERMSRAQWLIKSLEQRARTILKVSRAIVAAQADFFSYGVENLKPMTLKEVADKVDVHESTVSRVTSGKFMQTPMGVFELKYFFSAGINTTGGNVEVAAASVKAMIKRLIEAEDLKKPLSDEKLVTLLKGEGIDVARRTVAKYREAQNIPSSSGRRVR